MKDYIKITLFFISLAVFSFSMLITDDVDEAQLDRQALASKSFIR